MIEFRLSHWSMVFLEQRTTLTRPRRCQGRLHAVASVILLVALAVCFRAAAQSPQAQLSEAPESPSVESQSVESQPETLLALQAQPSPQPSPQQSTAQPTPTSSTSSGSSTPHPPASGTDAERQKREEAERQIKQEEQQRVLGVVPTFNISYIDNAVSLTAAQKLSLALRTSIDPVSFATPFLVAGYHEALDQDTGFGWGPSGLLRRTGAAYLDAFDGTMIGNGFLPALLHQDPRYFRLGHGTVRHRVLYALATNFICKHDNTGKWEPNYSNVLGNIAAGALSNLYYPSSNTGIGLTISNGLIVTVEGGFGSLFNEFWPDLSRKYLHKDPTHGLDAQAQARDAATQPATPR